MRSTLEKIEFLDLVSSLRIQVKKDNKEYI